MENATRDAAPAEGISSTVAISTNRDCTWTASTNAAWIAITSATTGQGSETLTYKVAANAEPVQRRGILEVNNTQISVLQDAAPCRYNVTPANTAISAAGGEIPIAIETLTGCAWTVSSAVAWIAPPANPTGNRSGTLALTVARNPAPVPRAGTVTIGPQTITIQQAAADPEPPAAPAPAPGPTPAPAPGPTPAPTPPSPTPAPPPTPTPPPAPTPPPTPAPCVFDISPTSNNVGSDATTGSIQVTAGSGCAWTAAENSNWLTIASGESGSGNGRIDYRVSANSGAARSAAITAAGKTFTIAQAAAPPPACSFSISPASQNVADAGGSGSIAVTASATSCAWTATTSAPWISLTGASSGTGSGHVPFTVAVNVATSARSATIAVAGKTFTVTQAASPPPPPPPCTFSIAPTSLDVADAGGSASIAVTASASSCTWSASANAPWLSVTSGASGTGNGSVMFTVAANAAAARAGTITIAGQTLTVAQAAAPAPPPCTFSIAPTAQNVADTATSGTVAVSASATTCAWSAASNAPWLIVTGGASGSGNGAVSFSVDANLGAPRTGTMTIAGQAFTVSQAAPPPPPPPPPCAFSIAPGSESFPSAGGNGSVMVTASASTCAWTAASNVDWVAVTSGASGAGSGPVLYTVSPHVQDSDRTGTITIAGQSFTVVQRHP